MNQGFLFFRLGTGLSAMALATVGTLSPMPAWAAQDGPTPEAHAERVLEFNIASQPLLAALADFTAVTGIQVIHPSAQAIGGTAPTVTGRLGVREALGRLLSGSGLSWRFSDSNTVVLEKIAAQGALTLDPVTVEGQASAAAAAAEEQTALGPISGYVATRAVTATKTDTPLIETPQSISVVPRDQIKAQNAQTLNQILRYTPGVTPETRGAVATRYDMMTIRGFDASMYLNGMRLQDLYYTSAQIDPYLLERVEVLKGPTSVMYGQAPAGGLVNQVSKRPTDTALHEIGLEVGSDDHFRATADFSGPLDAQGKFLYRLTATGLTEDGQIDTTENERMAIAPAFTWKPDGDTRLTLLGLYQNDPKANSYGSIPPRGTVLYNPYGTLSTDFYDGDPNFERFEREQSMLGYEFEKDLDRMWTLRMNARASHTSLAYDSVYGSSLAADNRTLSRGTASSREGLYNYTTDNQIEAKVATGPLRHTLLGGLDYRYTTGFYAVGFGSAPSLDIFAPVYGMTITAPALTRYDVTGDQLGLYGQDQIRFGGFVLTLGGRHDRAAQTVKGGGTTTEQDDSAWTGKAGLTYVFDNGLAPYASYSESFTPVSGADYAGNPFKPEEGTQYEIGVKYQPSEHSLFTAAIFDLVRSNTTTGDPAHSGFSIQTGESRSRGLELEARTALTDHLDVIAAYTYLDTKVTKDNSGLEGNRLGAVPRHQASAWAMYRMPEASLLKGLGVGGGVRYVGSTINPGNTIRVPEYTLVDAALTYDMGAMSSSLDGAELALNVKNLFDKRYVASCYYGEWCAYGYDRTVTASLRYQW